MVPIYEDAELVSVSPLVIDIDAAQQAWPADRMMAMLNAIRPQQHVSIIDTTLDHEQLARHLRRFSFIAVEGGQRFTLRFADCAVLPELAAALSLGQWATLAGPMARWSVHQRDGTLAPLPQPDRAQSPVPTPLTLTSMQIDELIEAMAPYGLISNVEASRAARPLSGTPVQQHSWASDARRLWHAAGHADNTVLISFASAVFDTHGKLLRHPQLPAILRLEDARAIRQGIRKIVGEC